MILLTSAIGRAQTTISSFVSSSRDSTPVAYASIGIKNKLLGCVADSIGKFVLSSPVSFVATDTIIISAIGYKSICLPLDRLSSNQGNYLEPQIRQLSDVKISSKPRLLEISNLPKGNGSFSMGWGNDGQGGEAGNIFTLASESYQILKVYAKIHTSYDSCWFRLRIRKFDGEVPAEELLTQDVIRITTVKQGFIEFDLSELHYSFSDTEIFIGIELLKHSAKGLESLSERNFMVYTGTEPAKFRSFHKWYSHTNWEEGIGHSFSIKVVVKQ